ncbi:hypothetical protein BD414DRAFT_477928 [Trametes punicea]|nr:hypothetical protein BD414DRAFT_477928 [Trametes punicea]
MPSTLRTTYSSARSSKITSTLFDSWKTVRSHDTRHDDERFLYPMRVPTAVPYTQYTGSADATLELQVPSYRSRMPRLAARTADNGNAATSRTPRSSGTSSGAVVSPLVSALIAVAIFVLSTLVIMKAIRSLRGRDVVPVYHKPPEEEKPRMWEVSLSKKPVPPCDARNWSQMMPVSVYYVPSCDTQTLALPPSAATTGTTRLSRSRSRDTRRSSWNLSLEKSAAKSGGADEAPRVQVAVLIAMPSPSVDEPHPPAPAYLGLAEA